MAQRSSEGKRYIANRPSDEPETKQDKVVVFAHLIGFLVILIVCAVKNLLINFA